MKVGVVLGGGGARCFAQIGVLQAFEEHGVTPVAFSACSSAAFIGALYAAGHSATWIRQLFAEESLLKLIDVDVGKGGLIGHKGIASFLGLHLPETFEELGLPFAVVATDVQAGELVVLRSGPLIPAVCASNAFPGVFHPVVYQGRYLIDGGALNEVPVDVIRPLTTEPVIAVDVCLPLDRKIDLPNPHEGTWWDKVTAPLTQAHPALPIHLLEKAYTLTQGRLVQLIYAMYPPDLIIKPDLADDLMPQSFSRFEEAVMCGYEKAYEVLEGKKMKLLV